jgi:hypothetical protein
MSKIYPSACFLIMTTCAVFVSGCFFSPSLLTPEQRSEKIEQLITEGGYSASNSYQIDSVNETWQHDRQSIGISILAPKAPGIYPLIIYLPGLGESEGGGQLWRENWAKSGYVVFSMQPVEISEALKELTPIPGKPGDNERLGDPDNLNDNDKSRPSKAVKSSELHYLGHQFFSQASLKKRTNHLLWAYAQLKLRTKAGQALFKKADLSRIILAGYDIGAQTTAAMIGEKVEINLPQAQDFSLVAAILLSPSVDMALGGLTTRDKNISMPLLVVTGNEDDDPYGISSPYVRTAIWEYAPSGNKYLLLLEKGGHQLLAGSNIPLQQSSDPVQESGEKTAPRSNQSRGGKGKRDNGSSVGSSSLFSDGKDKSSHGSRQKSEQEFKHIAAVFSISTAFMDSVSKSDQFAKSWLSSKAGLWLKKSASFKIK